MNSISRVWVVGAGAVGSSLAALLQKGQKVGCFLVGASPHWEKIRQEGLRFHAMEHPEEILPVATRSWEELPALGAGDMVLLAGKATDLASVAQKLSTKLGPEAVTVVLQNGLGMRERGARILGRPVEGGVVIFGTRSLEPGQVSIFRAGRVEFSSPQVAELFISWIPQDYCRCLAAADYRRTEWEKLALNCLANPLAGILNAPNHLLVHPTLNPAKEAILAEVKAVAQAEGVEISLTVEHFNQNLKGDNIPSMRTDIDRGRTSEIDFINGAVVELAAKHGLAAPANQVVAAMVRYLTR